MALSDNSTRGLGIANKFKRFNWLFRCTLFTQFRQRVSMFSRHLSTIIAPILLLTVVSATKSTAQSVYDQFSDFCITSFGAEKEPLVYERFGDSLIILEDDFWHHVSRNSATFSFRTNIPAKGIIEYGKNGTFVFKSEPDERHFYRHILRLKNLEAGQSYSYRLVCTDERGNKVYSDHRSFTTPMLTSYFEIPGHVQGPPYHLDKEGASYILTEDITTPSTALNIDAADITIDLNGHTVTYDNVAGAVDDLSKGEYTHWAVQGPHGIRTGYRGKNPYIVNGTIVQGAGRTGDNGVGNPVSQPIYATGATIRGITVRYGGDLGTGIMAPQSTVAFCVIEDEGTLVSNRSSGCAGIFFQEGGEAYGNLLKRVRHKGIGAAEVCHSNEMYLDSWATNSIGIASVKGHTPRTYHSNLIFGTGYHVVAIGWTLDAASNVSFANNFVHLVGRAPQDRFSEYGHQVSLNGIRLTQYLNGTVPFVNWLYENNVISIDVKGSATINGKVVAAEGRGVQLSSDPYIKNLVFRNNIVKVIADDDPNITRASCVVTQGVCEDPDAFLPVQYINNSFITNFCHLRFGDYYSSGSNHQFIDCHFTRVGNDPRYAIKAGYWKWDSKNHTIINPTVTGEIDFKTVAWEGSGIKDFTLGYTTLIGAPNGTEITVRTSTGSIVDSLTISSDKAGFVNLASYRNAETGLTALGPYTVTAQSNGAIETQTLIADKTPSIGFFGSEKPSTALAYPPRNITPVPNSLNSILLRWEPFASDEIASVQVTIGQAQSTQQAHETYFVYEKINNMADSIVITPVDKHGYRGKSSVISTRHIETLLSSFLTLPVKPNKWALGSMNIRAAPSMNDHSVFTLQGRRIGKSLSAIRKKMALGTYITATSQRGSANTLIRVYR